MASKLTKASYCTLTFLLLSLGTHIAGLVTNFWCIGEQDGILNNTEPIAMHVHFGLFKQVVEYQNGTIVESETWLRLKEEQFLIVAIAGLNTALCLILYIKAIHIIVGISSFIMMTLMLLCAIYTFARTDETVRRMQDYHSNWPKLALGWSFACVFAGLVVNIISSVVYLTILLVKGERKETRSSKGLGPPIDTQDVNDKVPIVTVEDADHFYDNVAYTNDTKTARKRNAVMCSIETQEHSHPADLSGFSANEIDISIEDMSSQYEMFQSGGKNSDAHENVFAVSESVTDLNVVEDANNESDISTVCESIRL